VIILDTDIFSLAQRGANSDARKLAERILVEKNEEICVTIITFEEQMRGWLGFIVKAKDEDKRIFAYSRLIEMLNDFAKLRVIGYEKEASFHYLRIVKSKIRIGTMDQKIGAIALARAATLVTRNFQDFGKIPGLKIEDWTKD
jgi:tRNA(fMet)-specific endonuclease VapC